MREIKPSKTNIGAIYTNTPHRLEAKPRTTICGFSSGEEGQLYRALVVERRSHHSMRKTESPVWEKSSPNLARKIDERKQMCWTESSSKRRGSELALYGTHCHRQLGMASQGFHRYSRNLALQIQGI